MLRFCQPYRGEQGPTDFGYEALAERMFECKRVPHFLWPRMSEAFPSNPAGHLDEGKGRGRYVAAAGAPPTRNQSPRSSACSQPGGHRRDLPAVLRALHGPALPAARLGAGRLHVQVRELHSAGARAGKGAGESGEECGCGRAGRGAEHPQRGEEPGAGGIFGPCGGIWSGARCHRVGKGTAMRACVFLPLLSRGPRMTLPLAVMGSQRIPNGPLKPHRSGLPFGIASPALPTCGPRRTSKGHFPCMTEWLDMLGDLQGGLRQDRTQTRQGATPPSPGPPRSRCRPRVPP